MKPRSFDKQVESRTLLASDARWRGLAFAHRITPEICEVPVGVADASTLLLTVAGRSEVQWVGAGREHRHTWCTGTLTYLERGLELRKLSSRGAQETYGLSLDPATLERWTGRDAAAGALLSRPLPSHIVDRDPHLLILARSMADEIGQGCPSGALYAESLCLAAASYFWSRHSLATSVRVLNGLTPSRLKRLKDYMRAHLAADPSLEDFARIVGMSPKHMSRCFKQAVGQSPYQYFLAQRIEASKVLLRTGDASVTEVSAALGFSSPSHFSTAFRKMAGTVPSAYRAEARRGLRVDRRL